MKKIILIIVILLLPVLSHSSPIPSSPSVVTRTQITQLDKSIEDEPPIMPLRLHEERILNRERPCIDKYDLIFVILILLAYLFVISRLFYRRK